MGSAVQDSADFRVGDEHGETGNMDTEADCPAVADKSKPGDRVEVCDEYPLSLNSFTHSLRPESAIAAS